MRIERQSLVGEFVALRPWEPGDAALLWELAAPHAEELFAWLPNRLASLEDFEAFEAKVLEEEGRGLSLPFVTTLAGSGELVGSTRFMAIDAVNRRAEIGSTWILPARQRTVVNTEAKYLMLRHAFMTWNCVRVELKTDALNARSRAAILRLGAREEGILRRHVLTHSGRFRDTVYFSILDSEWPGVEEVLRRRISSGVDRILPISRLTP